jgi:hypothetical protein
MLYINLLQDLYVRYISSVIDIIYYIILYYFITYYLIKNKINKLL